jgi:hypothetical protein
MKTFQATMFTNIFKVLHQRLLDVWSKRVHLGKISTNDMEIDIYTDSSIIGVYNYGYSDMPGKWFSTTSLMEHLTTYNVPFKKFLDQMNHKGERMSELTIHNLTWAGSSKQKSFRFMTATVKSTSCPYPFVYLFRGDCAAILVILNNNGAMKSLTCKIKKGSGWHGETFAGMISDQDTSCREADPEIIVAVSELKEEFGALFKNLKIRRVGPPACLSIGGCDEFCHPFVAEMKVSDSFEDAVMNMTTDYKDEKFTFVIEKLDDMIIDDAKKALCVTGYAKNPSAKNDVCEGISGVMTAEDIMLGLYDRLDELRILNEVGETNIMTSIIKMETKYPHFSRSDSITGSEIALETTQEVIESLG